METRELVIENRDGKRMPSTLRRPPGAPRGTIILLHGLGGLRDERLIRRAAERFAEDGYATLAYDDSHGVHSLDARFFEATPTQSVRDAEDAIAWARKQDWFVPPLMLLGHSMGGFAAVRYAKLHPGTVDRLVLLAPAVSWRAIWGAELLFILVWLVTGRQKMLSIDEDHFKLGRSWILDFMKYDLSRDAPAVSVPVLVAVAERDEVIPSGIPAFARKLPRAACVAVPGADHDFDGREDEVVATITQWLTSS